MRALRAVALLLALPACEMILSFDEEIGADARPDGGPDAVVCGNGRLDPGEDCDDATNLATGSCPMCRFARCGDGLVREGIEECDPGGAPVPDGGLACSSSCLLCAGADANLARSANGNCYQRFAAPVGFTEAEAACYARGSHLFAVRDINENADVVFGLAPPDQVWIGLHDRVTEGTFRWITDEPVTFTNWSTGNPNNGGGVTPENCSTVTTDGSWNDAPCGTMFGYLCEQTPWIVRPEDGHAYRVIPGDFVWLDARARCEAAGGHLATITSLEENTFLSSQLTGRPWIGAADMTTEGTFEWITGEPFGFAAWNSGEPNDGMLLEDCVQFLTDMSAWNDANCDGLRAALCEVEP